MKTFKISTILITLLFFANSIDAAEKIICKKYTGTYKEFSLAISFSQNGKMLIEVEEKEGGGYFSTPGSYKVRENRVDFFYKGLSRIFFIGKDSITASPYTFSIEDDYETEIVLTEDKSYTCK